MRLAHSVPWRLIVSAPILLGLASGTAIAGAADPASPPKCRKAEINPVTGHVLCIDPLGVPVEAPPEEAKPLSSPRTRGASEVMDLLARPSLAGAESPVYQSLSIRPETRRNGFKTANARCFIADW